MDINEMQKLIVANAERYSEKHNIDVDLEWLLLKLTEENGEFANALLIYTEKCRDKKKVSPEEAKENLDEELMDVFTIVVLLADKLGVDILETLEKKVLEKGRQYLGSK